MNGTSKYEDSKNVFLQLQKEKVFKNNRYAMWVKGANDGEDSELTFGAFNS